MPLVYRALLLLVLPLLTITGAMAAWSPPLDTVNQFTPMLFVANMAILVFGVKATGGWARSAVLAASILALYLGGMSLLGERISSWRVVHGPCSGPTVKVATQNLWSVNRTPWQTAEALKTTGADVLLLQEVRGSGEEVVRLLRPAFPYAADCSSNPWCSLTILSKKPILRWRFHQGRWVGPAPDVATYVVAEIDTGSGTPMTVVTTHLLHLSDHALQSRQIGQLVGAMAPENQDALVIGGDMNLTPWTFALRTLDKFLGIPRVSRNVATWPARAPLRAFPMPAPFPLWPIDHIYAGRDWRACRVVAGPRTGSDHYSVVATLVPAVRPARGAEKDHKAGAGAGSPRAHDKRH